MEADVRGSGVIGGIECYLVEQEGSRFPPLELSAATGSSFEPDMEKRHLLTTKAQSASKIKGRVPRNPFVSFVLFLLSAVHEARIVTDTRESGRSSAACKRNLPSPIAAVGPSSGCFLSRQ